MGYQASFVNLVAGLFLFEHSCMTTLAIPAVEFTDLYEGPVFDRNMMGSDQCEGHCLHEEDLDPCPAQCECAYVRDVLHQIDVWPKRSAVAMQDA